MKNENNIGSVKRKYIEKSKNERKRRKAKQKKRRKA